MLVIPRWKTATFMNKWIGGNQRFWRHNFYEKKTAMYCISRWISNLTWEKTQVMDPWTCNFRWFFEGEAWPADRLSFSSLTSSVLMLAAGLCGFGKPICVKSVNCILVEKRVEKRRCADTLRHFSDLRKWVGASQGALDAWWRVDPTSMRNSRPWSRTSVKLPCLKLVPNMKRLHCKMWQTQVGCFIQMKISKGWFPCPF